MGQNPDYWGIDPIILCPNNIDAIYTIRTSDIVHAYLVFKTVILGQFDSKPPKNDI